MNGISHGLPPETDLAEHDTPRRGGPFHVLRALLTGLGAGFLVLVLGIGIAAIALPAATGSTALTVMTSSMEPTLPPGTMIVISRVASDEIVPGDIITYQLRSGEPVVVTHRVTQRLATAEGEPLFVTKGDQNPAPDPSPVQAVQVQGKLWYAIPFIGWFATIVSGETRTLLVTVGAGLLFAYAAWMVVAALRERRSIRSAKATAPDGSM